MSFLRNPQQESDGAWSYTIVPGGYLEAVLKEMHEIAEDNFHAGLHDRVRTELNGVVINVTARSSIRDLARQFRALNGPRAGRVIGP